MVGETSDNLPGIPGVGPKTAAKWINAYDGLEGVLASADKITGKAGENLRANLDQVRLNRQLNALLTDMELPLGPDDLLVQPWDREAMHRVFDALEFTALRERLFALAPRGAGRRGGLRRLARLARSGRARRMAHRAQGTSGRARRRGQGHPGGR
ncbi:5'-3' exonuclease H3TH domain-containing protein [Oerskovia sp. M15]